MSKRRGAARPRTRRRTVLAVLLAAFAFLFLLQAPLWSVRVLAARLGAFFQRPVSVGAVVYHGFPLQIEMRDLRVAGGRSDAPPFLEVARVVVLPRLSALWWRQTTFSQVEIEGLIVRVNAFREGGDDLPVLRTGAAGSRVRIDRLIVRQSALLLDHQRVPLELEVPRFEGGLEQAAGYLRGRLAFGPGSVRFGSGEPLGLSADADLALRGTRLSVAAGHLRTRGTDLAYEGALELAPRPQGRFTLRGPVDLAVIDHHVVQSGFGLQGHARYDGTVALSGSRLSFEGRVEGTAGSFDGVPVPRYAGSVAWDESGLRLSGLQLAALGGEATLDVDVPPGAGPARLRGSFRDLDAEALAVAAFDLSSAGLASAATGETSLEWPRGRFREVTGRFVTDLAPLADDRTPAWGRLEWSASAGDQTVHVFDLRTATTLLRLQGGVGADGAADLQVEAETRDLADADDLGLRVRRALGAVEPQPAGLAGAGSFRGRWVGTLASPVFEGRFSGRDVAYLGVDWGSAEWSGTLTSGELRSDPLVLTRAGAELRLEGRSQTGFFGEDDALDLRLRLRDWPAADLARALDWDVAVSGPATGEAEIQGRRSAPFGTARVAIRDGSWFGVAFADLDVRAEMRGRLTEVLSGRARVAGGSVSFRGTATEEGLYDGSAEAEGLELGELVSARRPGLRWTGRVTGRATLQGSLERPRLLATLASPRVQLGGEPLGPVEATLRGTGDGRVAVSARCRSERVDLSLSGSVDAAPPFAAALTAQARQSAVDPFLRSTMQRLPPALGLAASGELRVSGPLAEPEALVGELTLGELRASLPEYPIENRGPVRIALRGGKAEVLDLHLAGEDTDLEVTGAVSLIGSDALDLAVKGGADLRVLSLVSRELRGSGGARVAVRLSGPRTAPRLDGTLQLARAGLRARGFPHGIEEVQGTVSFTEQVAHFEGVTGVVAGGPVELTGQATHAQGRLTSFDLRATGSGLSLRYPEGLRSVVDADLRLYGDPDHPWLGGRVDVKDAVWDRRYDVASELLAEGRAWQQEESLGEGLRYDVRIVAPGTLRVDNNLATLQARAELTLQGTVDSPVLLGRADVERGRVYFQGNTYLIRRGSLDFANPRRTEPLFDIEAETRVRTYRVTLRVNGTLDRVYPSLVSDPPLTTTRILALLAGADESAVAELQQVETERLAYAGAATLAAGRISEEFGLEKGAARLGLDRFSIDPSVVRGNVTNPTARLTVGKRLTPDVNVIYSVDLRGTEERLVSVEYTLSDRLSLLMTRVEPGGFGFDLRLRQSR